MKKVLLRSKKKREKFNDLEYKLATIRSISSNANFICATRWNSLLFLTKIRLGITKLTKRCLISNRKNIKNNDYKVSRIVFLNCARQGFIYGLIKST